MFSEGLWVITALKYTQSTGIEIYDSLAPGNPVVDTASAGLPVWRNHPLVAYCNTALVSATAPRLDDINCDDMGFDVFDTHPFACKRACHYGY